MKYVETKETLTAVKRYLEVTEEEWNELAAIYRRVAGSEFSEPVYLQVNAYTLGQVVRVKKEL